MTFYMGITKSVLYFEALAAYDKKYGNNYNAKIQAEINSQTKILANLQSERKKKLAQFNSQIKQLDGFSKQLLLKFHKSDEYSMIYDKLEKLTKENGSELMIKNLSKQIKALDTAFKNSNKYLSI